MKPTKTNIIIIVLLTSIFSTSAQTPNSKKILLLKPTQTQILPDGIDLNSNGKPNYYFTDYSIGGVKGLSVRKDNMNYFYLIKDTETKPATYSLNSLPTGKGRVLNHGYFSDIERFKPWNTTTLKLSPTVNTNLGELGQLGPGYGLKIGLEIGLDGSLTKLTKNIRTHWLPGIKMDLGATNYENGKHSLRMGFLDLGPVWALPLWWKQQSIRTYITAGLANHFEIGSADKSEDVTASRFTVGAAYTFELTNDLVLFAGVGIAIYPADTTTSELNPEIGLGYQL